MRKKGRLKLKNRFGAPFQTENWHKQEYEDDPDSKPEIFRSPPSRYEQHFLAKMDKRSRAYVLLKESFDEITADRGGAESLSHVQLTLIERFCFLEYILRLKELQMADPNANGDRDKAIGSWVQSLNALVGLVKAVGLERRMKKVACLQDYVKSKSKKKI